MNREAETMVGPRAWRSLTKFVTLERKGGGVVTSEKKELWKRCIEKMSALPWGYCRKADGKIFSAVLGLPEYRNTKTVFCFVGVQVEIQTASSIEEVLRAGKQVVVPRCAGKDVIHTHVIRGLTELRLGTMGILEPSAGAPVLPPEELGLIPLPCVSAGRSGEHLGYGGSFYGHYLPKTKTFRALLIRERLLSDDIPREAHGQPVDAVITKTGIFRRAQNENGGVS